MNKAKWPAFWFLLPAALLFIIFFYWPLLQNLYLSFFSWNMISPTMKYVGQSNYIDILGSKELYKIIGNTVIFVLIMLLFNCPIWTLSCGSRPGQNWYVFMRSINRQ